MVDLWKEVELGSEEEVSKGIVNAIIEIPKGSKNKYELDKKAGIIKLDRVLYASMEYPIDYGFLPQTYAEDGDPLDVMVISTIPFYPATLVKVRVIGVMKMIDTGEQDDKLIGVVASDPRLEEIKTLEDLPSHTFKEWKHFFEHYKELQGKKVTVEGFEGIDEAMKILNNSIKRFNEKYKR